MRRAVVIALVALGAWPAAARAAVFYASQSGSSSAGSCPIGAPCTLDHAVTLANGDPAPDTVQVSGTLNYDAGFPNSPIDLRPTPVELVGSGQGPGGTTLDGGTTNIPLFLGGQSSARDLNLRAGSSGVLQMKRGSALTRATVIRDGTTNNGAITIDNPGGSITTGEALLDHVDVQQTAPGTAVTIYTNTGTTRVLDSTIRGESGGISFGGAAATDKLVIQRSTIAANIFGVGVTSATLAASSSVIRALPAPANFDGVVLRTFNTVNASADLRQLTIDGSPSPQAGSGIRSETNGSGGTASVTVHGSILRGFGVADLSCGTAGTISIGTSDYATASPTGCDTSLGGNVSNVDPRFLDQAGGDYRLRFDSPVIDAAGTAAPTGDESSTDRAGNPRVVDGDAVAGAARDMGAYEYQARPPTVVATAVPTTAAIGESVTFDGSGSSDPDGDALTSFAWSFDDGASGVGVTVGHAFATAGSHSGTLTVTDASGRSASATLTVTVPAPPGLPAPPDVRPPVENAAVLRPDAFRAAGTGASIARATGTRVSYTVSEAATTTFTVERARPGVKRGRRCVAPTPRRAGGRPCTRWVRVQGSFSHRDAAGRNGFRFTGRVGGRSLTPGRYRLVAVPRDLAGNVGRAVRSPFGIVP